MNRAQRRIQTAKMKQEGNKALTRIHEDEWPDSRPRGLKAVWRSKKYLVQLLNDPNGYERLSINKVELTEIPNGIVTEVRHRWADGLTWDELQQIKRDVGFGDRVAVEVYPRDQDIVNVANMRHLWLLPEIPDFYWRKR